MESARPRQRTPEEKEDIIIRKIFLFPVKNSSSVDCHDHAPVLLSKETLESALVNDVLSNNQCTAFYDPFSYLLEFYRRASDEETKIKNIKDVNFRSRMEHVVLEAKKVAVKYCRIHLGNPGTYVGAEIIKSPLLPLIYGELGYMIDGVRSPHGFLRDFFDEGDFDVMMPVLGPLFDELSEEVKLENASVGLFQKPLNALSYLVKFQSGRMALVFHDKWLVAGNNETDSILGPFFHVSPLQTEFLTACVSATAPDARMPSLIDMINCMNMKQWQSDLHDIFYCLLKNSETREKALEFLAAMINKNSARAQLLQVDPLCATSGMFVNLSAVMLRLCQPFLNQNLMRSGKIDARYVFCCDRLDFKQLTALHASSQEVSAYVSELTCGKSDAKYSVISELFFMTARVMHLGLLKAFSEWRQCAEIIAHSEQFLSDLQAGVQEQGGDVNMDWQRASVEEDMELQIITKQCYGEELLRDGFVQYGLSFYGMMVVRLAELVGGFKMPLPSSCPMEFSGMPEHFVEDAMDMIIIASKIKGSSPFKGVNLDDFINFIIMFMASPEYIKNPYLRTKMVQALNCLIPKRTLFENGNLSKYLVRNLLKLYVDVQSTGSQTEFHDKYMRREIAQLLEHLLKGPTHTTAWRQFAEEEKGVYLNFLNFLISDNIYLLDECLSKTLELRALEAEMSNEAEWNRRPAEEQSEKIRLLRSQEKFLTAGFQLANKDISMMAHTAQQVPSPFLHPEVIERVATMLNYFLLKLVGPGRKLLRLKDPEKYKFRPKVLLQKIVETYVYLARSDKENVFPAAISKENYNPNLFTAAADIVVKFCEDSSVVLVQDLLKLNEMAKNSAVESMDIDPSQEDIPEEFMDPIQCTLIKDPVILPSSKVTVDRAVILRHLLNNKTDPFNRSELTPDMLIPDSDLKARIEDYLKHAS